MDMFIDGGYGGYALHGDMFLFLVVYVGAFWAMASIVLVRFWLFSSCTRLLAGFDERLLLSVDYVVFCIFTVFTRS